MDHKVKSYLRTVRRRSGLTQAEVAFLLGAGDGPSMSRYERLSRRPSFRTALGFQAVFGIPVTELLPGISADVERKVIERAHLLSRRLERQPRSACTERKLAFLASIAARDGMAREHLWEKDKIAKH
jgi:transcriptional regulator with XRE-family HTH domain